MSFAEPRARAGRAGTEAHDSPRHGDQGDRAPAAPRPRLPASLTLTISREAGSRGNTIGTRAGLKLGWPVYNRELLGYASHEGPLRQGLDQDLTPDAARWVDAQLARIRRERHISDALDALALARTVLALAAQGEVVLIGRGAGFILPRQSTLSVRVVAPLPDRVAYMSQWLRLTDAEAAEQVRARDRRRAEYLAANFRRQPNDVYQYDLVLNSGLLGEELCGELIVQAARAKLHALRGASDERGPEEPATEGPSAG